MLEIKKTEYTDSMKKPQIIKEIAQVTNMTQGEVTDVLNAFTDLAIREMVTTGAFAWPGLPTVTRIERKGVKRYQSDLDKTLLYPNTYELRARVPASVKKYHREMIRNNNNEINGVSREDWWKPYFYCDGDFRKQDK